MVLFHVTDYILYVSGRDGFQVTLSGKYPCVPLQKKLIGNSCLSGGILYSDPPHVASGFGELLPPSAAVCVSDRAGT